jgi:hypothetical protein
MIASEVLQLVAKKTNSINNKFGLLLEGGRAIISNNPDAWGMVTKVTKTAKRNHRILFPHGLFRTISACSFAE